MFHELSGDLLLSTARVLVHGIAPGDDFKSGLALALREHYPAMYKDFRHYCKTTHPKAGSLWTWTGMGPRNEPVTIVSLFTQEPAPGEGTHAGPARREYVNRALHELRRVAAEEKWPNLALPRLATGVGKLDWESVFPMIRSTLGDLGIPVFVYTSYVKGVAAKEPGAPATIKH